MFGQSTESQNRFSTLQINFPQQQQQQQNQPSQNASQTLNSSTSLSGGEENWYNIARKRNIPQSVIKRSSKPSSSDATSSTEPSTQRSGFGTVQFGAKKQAFNVPPQTQSSDIATYIESNEAPPTKSLYDWKREDEFGSLQSTTSMPTSIEVSLKQGISSNTPNVFDRSSVENGIKKNRDEISEGTGEKKSQESAVLVFGYPESISNQIIQHFSKFGNILEDFEVLRGVTGINISSNTIRLRSQSKDALPPKKYPIFTGDGWVKLTYDSPSSALRALQENGTVYGGTMIGCVPYSKVSVEQLASCKIDKADDIGALGYNLSMTISGGNGSELASQRSGDAHGNARDSRFAFSARKVDVKDGRQLFVHNGSYSHNGNTFFKNIEQRLREQEVHASEQKNPGIVGRVNNWLFGWNDL